MLASVVRRVPAWIPLIISFALSIFWLIDIPLFLTEGILRPYYHIDLDVYRAGGQAWLEGKHLYAQDYEVSGGMILPFTYPPLAAMLFSSLSVASLPVVSVVWTVASWTGMWVCLWLVLRPLKKDAAVTWAAWCMVPAVVAEPITESFSFGQVNILLTLIVLVDFLVLPRRLRGVLLGLAISIKLTPAVFVLVYFARREWRALATTAVAVAGWVGVGFLAAPVSSRDYWLQTLRDSERIGGLAYSSNQSLRGFLERIGAGDFWLAGVAVVIAACVVAVYRVRAGGVVPMILIAAQLSLLASPVSWSHHYVWLVLLAAYVTALVPRSYWLPGLLWLVLFARGHWLVPNTQNQELEWSLWQAVPGNDYFWLTWVVVLCALVAPRYICGGFIDQPSTGTLLKAHSASAPTAEMTKQ